ncbi:MAG: helix-turn-helix domain-containing protein [Deltaproteobacteria bacterium]|nr:helix-turn-helix domain-containing protein [Deltaproteobacteria bacterium]
MQPIPLIGAENVERIAGLLEANGVPAERYLENARILPSVRDHPSAFLPGRSVWEFVGAVDRGEGLGDFWLDIARTSDWRRAAWVHPLTHAVTLGDAIRAMCISYARQIPMNELGLTVCPSVAWFWRRRVCRVRGWPGSEPAEQYTLSFMLAVIRAAAGPRWLPERLRVECSSSGWPAVTNQLPGVRIEYDQPLLALAIPMRLLSVPVSIVALPAADEESEPPAMDFRGSLRQVLEPRLADGPPSQAIAAEMLWTTPRTLRRRLAEEGTTWHRVISDLKFARAVERLQEGRSTVGEIAEELGYSDTAHFTRFFRRRAGIPPSSYREEIERATQPARRPLS